MSAQTRLAPVWMFLVPFAVAAAITHSPSCGWAACAPPTTPSRDGRGRGRVPEEAPGDAANVPGLISEVTPMDPRIHVLTGQRFGLLLVESLAHERPVAWNVVCDCGTHKAVRGAELRSGKTVSCGCFRRRGFIDRLTSHGLCGTPEHTTWCSMIARCEFHSQDSYPLYGGRGIRVCEEWRHDCAAFVAHVGPRPSKHHSIDRIDNNGHYEPGNVRWATRTEQARNTRATVRVNLRGQMVSMAAVVEEARAIGVGPGTTYDRLRRGWDPERAATTPPTRKWWGSL